jgi:selenocysteine lyase/cysteine desulfurase
MGTLLATATVKPIAPFTTPDLPAKASAAYNEAYWQLVKDHFSIRPGYVMMNAANLCPSPYQVYDAVSQLDHALERDVSFQHRQVFAELESEVIQALSEYLNAEQEALAITRNTSESNNTIVNGLDLGPGDEVLLWEQNHPTNLHAWEQRARRMGFSVKVIALPANPSSAEQVVDAFADAVSDNTKLLAFSHISNVSGLRLPAAEICAFARSRNIMSLVDGAQSFGFMDIDLRTMACDFYTGSAHKWLMGPKETGVLYVRKPLISKLWPNMVAAGYEGKADDDISRLVSLGQRHNASLAGLKAVLHFHKQIGKEAVEARTMHLTKALREQLTDKLDEVEWITPEADEFRAGVLIFKLPGLNERQIFSQLYDQYQIACAPTGGLRLSPHIYNSMEDVAHVVDALAKLSRA